MSINAYPYWPRKIVVGAGSALKLADEAKLFEGKKIIFFTDKGLVDLAKTKEVVQALVDAGYSVDVYCDLEANPTDLSVHKAVDHMHETKPDIMVCYGGGSAIDTGKAANVVYTHGGRVHEYEDLVGGIEKIKDRLLPCIAVATTAGTGSEVSNVSVITDTTRVLKIALISAYIVPNVSVLDPEVTVSLPASLTAYTGMDALTHCIEAYVSSVDFEPGRGFAIQGIKVISRSLRKAVLEGGDLKARQDLLIGSACGSMAFNNNMLGTVHGCAHQLSSVANLPHGLANAIMLVPVMRWNIPSNMEAFADVAQAMGADIHSLSLREAAEKSVELAALLSEDVGIPKHLSECGVTEAMLDELVDKAFLDHNNLTNPRRPLPNPTPIPKDVLRKLYLEVF